MFPLAGAALMIAAQIAGDASAGYTTQRSTCRVVAVVDGDTVKLFCPGARVQSARLTGFDTPEVFSPRCLAELFAGLQATWALRWRLWMAERTFVRRQGHDRYGRVLARLSVDGVNVAHHMMSSGHARAYAGGARSGWC